MVHQTNRHGIPVLENSERYDNARKPTENFSVRRGLRNACLDIGFDSDFYTIFEELIEDRYPIGIDTCCLELSDCGSDVNKLHEIALRGHVCDDAEQYIARFEALADGFLTEIDGGNLYVPNFIVGELLAFYTPMIHESVGHYSERIRQIARKSRDLIKAMKKRSPITPEFDRTSKTLTDLSEDTRTGNNREIITSDNFSEDTRTGNNREIITSDNFSEDAGTSENDRKLIAIALGLTYPHGKSGILTRDGRLRVQAYEEGPTVASRYGFECTASEIINQQPPAFSLAVFERVNEL